LAHQSTNGRAFVTSFTPEPEVTDTMPSDKQPPGVDEKKETDYNSLEEALTS
tara:strand:- start:197 stop:352 length:156 start_codon:yes stop_codon:yes gene_type:complete